MPFSTGSTKNIQIVFIYSSHTRQDENLRKSLEAHLSGLNYLDVSIKWYNSKNTLQSFDNDNNHIFKLLNTADMVALLVTPEFIHLIQNTSPLSDAIQWILQRGQREEIIVVPLLIRQVYGWERYLGDLTPLPKDRIAVVSSRQNRDDTLFEVAKGIEEIIENFKKYQQKLQEYRHLFSTKIHEEYPLSQETITYLNNLKQNRALKNQDTELIEQEISAKAAKEYHHKIQQYKQKFFQEIQWSNTLSDTSRERLKTVQKKLGLKDEVVTTIEHEVTEQIFTQPIRRLIGYGNQSTPKVAIATIIIGVTAFLGFCQTSPEMQVNNLLKQGENKLEIRDYQGASEDYTQAIQIAPKNIDAYIKRGYAYYSLKNYKAARKDYTQAIKIEPKNIEVYIKRGHTNFFLKDYQAAIKDYTQAISLAPDSVDAYKNRAAVHLKLRNRQEAIKDYQKTATIYKKQGATDDLKKVLNKLQKLQHKKSRSSN